MRGVLIAMLCSVTLAAQQRSAAGDADRPAPGARRPTKWLTHRARMTGIGTAR